MVQTAQTSPETSLRREVLARAEAFTCHLQAELAMAAWSHAEMAQIIAELAA
jgi:hypothetical protein